MDVFDQAVLDFQTSDNLAADVVGDAFQQIPFRSEVEVPDFFRDIFKRGDKVSPPPGEPLDYNP